MKIRCPDCQASFIVPEADRAAAFSCPSCGRSVRLRNSKAGSGAKPSAANSATPIETGTASGVSVFVPSSPESEAPKASRGWKTYSAVGVALLLIAVVLAAWPWIKQRLGSAEPKDPVERVAKTYLKALESEDPSEARRLGTVEEPPAIRGFGKLERQRDRDRTLKGSFAPIARLNKRIDADFTYDSKIGRLTPKNPLGPAAETLDALHAAKEKAEKSGLYDKMASGNPDDLFDAAENYGKVFTQLAEGALSPKRILPTYEMLVKEAKPALPEIERELALDYGQNREIWDAILKRPFLTLRADGPFIFDRAEVHATVFDRLASLGDPPSTLSLKLIRFRLEGIDTGWKVISAQRVLPGSPDNDPTKTEAEALPPTAPNPEKNRETSPGTTR